MRATIEDLRKGDVVLLSSQKGIYEAKLLRQPTLAKTGKLVNWFGQKRWMSIPCAVLEETLVRQYTDHQGGIRSYNYTKLSIANGREYTKNKRIDLTGIECWIIKRETL